VQWRSGTKQRPSRSGASASIRIFDAGAPNYKEASLGGSEYASLAEHTGGSSGGVPGSAGRRGAPRQRTDIYDIAVQQKLANVQESPSGPSESIYALAAANEAPSETADVEPAAPRPRLGLSRRRERAAARKSQCLVAASGDVADDDAALAAYRDTIYDVEDMDWNTLPNFLDSAAYTYEDDDEFLKVGDALAGDQSFLEYAAKILGAPDPGSRPPAERKTQHLEASIGGATDNDVSSDVAPLGALKMVSSRGYSLAVKKKKPALVSDLGVALGRTSTAGGSPNGSPRFSEETDASRRIVQRNGPRSRRNSIEEEV